jgi:hypothetical protein
LKGFRRREGSIPFGGFGGSSGGVIKARSSSLSQKGEADAPTGSRAPTAFAAADGSTYGLDLPAHAATITYDALGQALTTIGLDGQKTTYTYKPLEFAVELRDPEQQSPTGPHAGSFTTLTSDAHGRIVSVAQHLAKDPIDVVTTSVAYAATRVVLLDEAIGVLPDRLKRARPGVLDADVSCAPRARRNFVACIVIDDWMNAGYSWPSTSRLHRMKRRHRAA